MPSENRNISTRPKKNAKFERRPSINDRSVFSCE